MSYASLSLQRFHLLEPVYTFYTPPPPPWLRPPSPSYGTFFTALFFAFFIGAHYFVP